MRCVVTAGPTFEPLDAVRRLTNFSTGRLGSELADYLVARGREVPLLAELVPTPKIIAELRPWFPAARIVAWKYEVEGDQPEVVRLAERQIAECHTDACVANGPAYGPGFGLVRAGGECSHLS